MYHDPIDPFAFDVDHLATDHVATDHLAVEHQVHVPTALAAERTALGFEMFIFTESHMYESDGQPVLAPSPSSHTIGTPLSDSEYWHFERINGMCGPDSLAMILTKYSGHQFTEQQVAQYAFTRDEMDPDGHPSSAVDLGYGMTAGHAAEVLNQMGVPSTLEYSNLDQLATYLHEGREVMLFVDADEIWHDDSGTQPNHWVVLTGIDPSTGLAYLNDPGTPDGAMEAVPISELMKAWATSDNTAIVTDYPSASAEEAAIHAAQPHTSASTGHTHPGPVLLPVVLEHLLLRVL